MNLQLIPSRVFNLQSPIFLPPPTSRLPLFTRVKLVNSQFPEKQRKNTYMCLVSLVSSVYPWASVELAVQIYSARDRKDTKRSKYKIQKYRVDTDSLTLNTKENNKNNSNRQKEKNKKKNREKKIQKKIERLENVRLNLEPRKINKYCTL